MLSHLKKHALCLLGGAVIGGTAVFLVSWHVTQLHDAELQARVAEANREADNWELAYLESAEAWTERAHQLLDGSEALADSLKEENRALANHLERAEADVLSLQRSVSRLEAKLDSSRSTVDAVGDSAYQVALDEAVYLDGGGFLRVRGGVRIRLQEPPEVHTDLGVRGRFPLTVVLSEEPDGSVRVDAFTGDPRLSIEQIDVTRNRSPATGGSASGLFAGVVGHFTGAESWFARAEGLLAGLLVCR